ncbi:arginyltransferase [Telmatocola sphagniphila]|uniref:Aspartate/glutamate leucyltransferase n=1 Tax=Telmatocola sphagniphila TaxID=1123043 RepID=A0A8E6BAS2_9BACT|nr:arginyltransferase [Telmatocola sphagniphila]QVL34419.1 arginyltransferase [Telmatocola sphagniphila]
MISLATYLAPLSPCGYLPDRDWQLEYEVVAEMTAEEYEERMKSGWRHFGHWLFHPKCPHCSECVSIRIPVADFQPNRSQRRAWKDNTDIRLEIGEPQVSQDRIDLHAKYHEFQSDFKGWPFEGAKDRDEYMTSFALNPFPVEEWRYFLGERCIGIGYNDLLEESLSMIYFFYDPEFRDRSLGTFNVLSGIARARELNLPYLYLGYYVQGCASLSYKNNFKPSEGLIQGDWIPLAKPS